MVALGDLPGGIVGARGYAASSNGAVVAGYGVSDRGIEAFRWTAATGMVGLGDLAGGGFFSEAYDVSADGSTVVGRSIENDTLFPSRAFRWSAEAGMVALPDIPGVGPAVIAQGISGNGNVIVGAAAHGDDAVAFAWDAFHGSRSVSDLLVAQGVDLDGFELTKANAASEDGLTIIGSGLPRGSLRFQPWIARLDPETFIPEPSSFAIGGIGIGALLFYLWCRGGIRCLSTVD
jgi:probable HAF family extracellular repeat protein